MSRKLTLSIVSVVALSFVLTTSEVQAEGRMARVKARVAQKAKTVGAKMGKWWNALPSVQLFKAGKAQRAKGLEHGKTSDKAFRSTRRAAWTAALTGLLGWKNGKHKQSAKRNARKTLKEQGQYHKDTMAGDTKMALATVAAPFDALGDGVVNGGQAAGRGLKTAGIATLGVAMLAKDYTVEKTVAAKDYTVRKATEAKNYTVEKTVAAKKAVVDTTTAAYQRGEAAVAHTKTAVKQSVNNAAQRVVDKTSQKSALEQKVAKRESAKTRQIAERRANLKVALESNAARGMSDARLGKMFGVSASTIRSDRKALGIGTAKQRLAAQKK